MGCVAAFRGHHSVGHRTPGLRGFPSGEASHSSMRWRIWSRTARKWARCCGSSPPVSAGSGTGQCRVCLAAGNTGQASRAEPHTVTTKSQGWSRYSSRCWLWCCERSIPTSAITPTAKGWTKPTGAEPADRASQTPWASSFHQPSAIWDRQEFPVQRIRTRFGRGGCRDSDFISARDL